MILIEDDSIPYLETWRYVQCCAYGETVSMLGSIGCRSIFSAVLPPGKTFTATQGQRTDDSHGATVLRSQLREAPLAWALPADCETPLAFFSLSQRSVFTQTGERQDFEQDFCNRQLELKAG